MVDRKNCWGKNNPFFGKSHTKEAKGKISLARQDTTLSKKIKQKIGQSLLGHNVSLETRKKISEKNIGRILSEKTRAKFRLIAKNRIVSEETRLKMSESHQGEKCHFWKGGISPMTNLRLAKWAWRKLREKIKKRDNHWCLYCRKQRGEVVHHMLPVRLGGTDNEMNLITLCRKCHRLIESKIVA